MCVEREGLPVSTVDHPIKGEVASLALQGFTIPLGLDHKRAEGTLKSMSTKYIVKIEKNGIAMEVEVNAITPNEAKQTALRMYPGYRLAAGMWRINPSDGKRILCS